MLRIVCSPELIDAVLARARFDLKHTGCVDTATRALSQHALLLESPMCAVRAVLQDQHLLRRVGTLFGVPGVARDGGV